MAQVVTKGLVIREQPYQESDKILTVFTEKEGKQKAIAKGARRSKNTLGAATQLFAYSEFVYYPGKNFASVSSASLIESFYPLRQDMKKMALGSYVLELLNVFFDYYQGNADLLKVAVHLLYYLSESLAEDERVLIAGFQMKASAIQGIKPLLEQCAYCRQNKELLYFNIECGGAVCRNCSSEKGYTYRLLPGQLKWMDLLIKTPMRDLRFKTIPSDIMNRIMDIMDHYIAYNYNQKLSAYQFYKGLSGTLTDE